MPGYWMTYEFSHPDSYEDFYRWVATCPAKAMECGMNVVLVDFDGSLEDLKESLLEEVKNIEKSRIYVVRTKGGAPAGTFLFGSRKLKNPWDVYAVEPEVKEDDFDSLHP